MRTRCFGIAAALALVAGGCPRLVPPSEWGDFSRAEDLLSALRRGRECLASVRASAVVTVQRGSRRTKLRAALAVKRPANLRLETESFFGQPVSVLVSDGFSYSLWQAEDGSTLRGAATPAEFMRLISLPLDGVELAGTLLGEPPLIAWARASLSRDEKRRCWLVRLSNSRERQLLEVDPTHLLPLRVNTWQEGKLLYSVTLESGPDDGLPVVPREVYFQMPAEDVLVHIRLREVEKNAAIDDGVFSLETQPPASDQAPPP